MYEWLHHCLKKLLKLFLQSTELLHSTDFQNTLVFAFEANSESSLICTIFWILAYGVLYRQLYILLSKPLYYCYADKMLSRPELCSTFKRKNLNFIDGSNTTAGFAFRSGI